MSIWARSLQCHDVLHWSRPALLSPPVESLSASWGLAASSVGFGPVACSSPGSCWLWAENFGKGLMLYLWTQVLATGLSGLYSSLPTKLEEKGEEWHCLLKDDWLLLPPLVQFMNSLEFCNAVIQVPERRQGALGSVRSESEWCKKWVYQHSF